MVPSLENRRPEVQAGSEQGPFRGRARVRREQDGHAAHPQPDHQGILVRWGGRRPSVRRKGGVEGFQRHGSHIETRAAAAPAANDAASQGPLELRIRPFSRGRRALPEFADPEVPGHGHEAVEVVRMGMGQDEVIDPREAFAPQDRRDDPLADIEGARGQAAPVDEHRPAARELDQDGLALADVDQGDAEVGGPAPERRDDEEQRQEGECPQHGGPLAAEARPDESEPEDDVIAREEPGRRRRDPDGQERKGVEGVGDPGKKDHEPAEQGRRKRGRAREERGEREEGVAQAHDQADERDGREVQDDRREGDPVEVPGDERGGPEGRRDGQRGQLGRLERQPGHSFEQGRGEEDDGQGGGVGQLEPDVEEAGGIGEKQGEGAGGDGVEDVDVLPEQPSDEEGQGHERGPEDRGAAFDEHRVENEEDGQGDAGCPP